MHCIFEITLPIKTISEANSNEHWTIKRQRHQIQKKWIMFAFLNVKQIPLPCKIKLTRLANRKLDSDNLVSAFKTIRDEIASHFIPGLAPGRADGDARLEWEYAQEFKSKAKEIKIEIFHFSSEVLQ